MTELRFEADIRATPEAVFDAVVDLRGYGRWLPNSKAYPGTTEVSDGPVGLGTSYTESAASGVRHGEITVFERPTRVTFRQPMTMKPALLGVIDIEVAYSFVPTPDGTHVERMVTMKLPAALVLARPIVVGQFRAEIERTMAALKTHLEASNR